MKTMPFVPRAEAARPAVDREWINRIPTSWIRTCGLGHRLGWALLTLESYARQRCYLWAGNAELARALGLSCGPDGEPTSKSALPNLLKELEAAGCIRRVGTPKQAKGRPGRIGIILLKRSDPDLPVCSLEELPEMVLRLKMTKTWTRDKSRGQTRLPLPDPALKSADDAPSNQGRDLPSNEGPMPPQIRGHHAPSNQGAKNYESLSLKNDETESSIQFAGEDSSRSTTTTRAEDPEPSPIAEPGHPAQAVAEEPELTPEPIAKSPLPPTVDAFLASLTPDDRAKFDGTNEAHRAKIIESIEQGTIASAFLATMTPGMNAVLSKKAEPERKRILGLAMLDRQRFALDMIQAIRPVAPPLPEPETTRELIERLGQPGAPRAWVHRAVNAIIEDFGNTAGDQKLRRGFEQVFSAVWEGKFPAAAVADAYRQGMKGENHGAVFNVALQRDHGWDWRQERPHD